MMRRRGIALTLAGIFLVLASGCGTVSVERGLSGCAPVPNAEIARIMATARRHFLTGGVQNDHMTFRSAAQYPMPPRLRAFGMTRIVVFLVTFWFSNPVSSQLGGVDSWAIFGSDESGTKVYPLDNDTAAGFALSVPRDKNWAAWRDRNVPHAQSVSTSST